MQIEERPVEIGMQSLEEALAPVDGQAVQCLASVNKLTSLVKGVGSDAKTGDLRGLRKKLGSIQEVLATATQELARLEESWTFSEAQEESYLSSGAYMAELRAAAQEADLGLYEQEGYWSCYPSSLKLIPRERAFSIDRKTERRLRPSFLVMQLQANQKKTPKANNQQLLETVYAVYCVLQPKGMEKLLEIYRVLTLFPGIKRDYTLQEFARDIYLLDASGLAATKDGVRFRLHPGATGSKNRSNLLVVTTRDGLEKTYFGIEFFGGDHASPAS